MGWRARRTKSRAPRRQSLAIVDVEARDPPGPPTGFCSCPDEIGVGSQFELTVGLSARQEPGVAGGRLVRPESSQGPYTLGVHVDADGFRLRDGEAWRNDLRVSFEAPFPTVTLHLTAAEQDEAERKTRIERTFAVDGQTIGLAVRYIVVGQDVDADNTGSRAAR